MKGNKYRTAYCGKITKDDIGKELRIAGFVENIRDHGGIIFVDVRDESGTIQTVSNDDKIFDDITRESSITLLGTIRKRSEDTINPRESILFLKCFNNSLRNTILSCTFLFLKSK